MLLIMGERCDIAVKALCYEYKLEGREFETQWDELIFFQFFCYFQSHLGFWGYSASNSNEYQKQKNNVYGE
jgi:hypothetical protein